LGTIDWVVTILTLVYLYFAIKNKPICFIFGILGSSVWAFISYRAGLIFDTGLQFFYIVISIIGIYRWKFGSDNQTQLPISEYPLSRHFLIFAVGAFSSYLLIYASRYIEFINLPVLDAITTVTLIIGTLLLIERKLSSWIYLVVGDIVYIYIYSVMELWLLAGIMFIYSILGTYGFINWQSLYKHQITSSSRLSSESGP